MKVTTILLTPEWRDMTEVNDGNEFLIQNLGHRIEFIVSETKPTIEEKGGILAGLQQLDFKKITGNLYMRAVTEYGNQEVYIERVE